MILIALGSNVNGPWGTPRQTVEKALMKLDEGPCSLVRASDLIETEPFGMTDQPAFFNAVAEITTSLPAEQLMAHLHNLELAADRRRSIRWGPRTLDLDLIDYDGEIRDGTGMASGHQGPLVLPHPGIAERLFVLEPIAQIAPHWRHPVSGLTAGQMIKALDA